MGKKFTCFNLFISTVVATFNCIILSTPLQCSASVVTPSCQIKYYAKDVSQVSLVWGINNWNTISKEFWPPNSKLNEGLLYSPMLQNGDTFSLILNVQRGTILDYVFHGEKIVQKKKVEFWNTNGENKKDFHTKINNYKLVLIDGETIIHKIQYHSVQASEVHILWGINGWKNIPEEFRPEETSIKDGLMLTKMLFNKDTFSVHLNVPVGTTIDYVFYLSKDKHNKQLAFWDTNLKNDYHSRSVIAGISKIEANTTMADAELAHNNINSNWIFLFVITLIVGIGYLIKRIFRLQLFQSSISLKTIAIIFTFMIFLIPVRAITMGYSLRNALSGKIINLIFLSAYYDYLYAIVIGIICLIIIFLFRKRGLAQKITFVFFIVLMVASLISSLLNIRIVQLLGKPFTYQWLYYSDFLGSTDAKNAVLRTLSTGFVLNIIYYCIGFALCCFASIQLISWLIFKSKYPRRFLFTFSGFFVYSLFVSNNYIQSNHLNYAKLANPVTAFVESVYHVKESPSLFTMRVPEKYIEFDNKNISAENFSNVPSNIKIKNVILFVMESTAAEYLECYGGKYPVSSTLKKYKSQSMIFNNFYSHTPCTNKSMVSILGSIYPWISYQSITNEHPEISMPTISSELKKNGYRNAFFSSGDNRFQKIEDFLSHRDFDKIEDFRNSYCKQEQFLVQNKDWSNPDGANDECIVNSLNNWVDENTTLPFFGMLWTVQTHYPYFFADKEIDYGTHNPDFNRYLNAANHTDEMLGKLLQQLKEKNLDESTLVVVVGDHGEAFVQHDQTGHASKIYEENLHIPCILINPLLFHGEENNTPGGLKDIAPTIMNILGFQTPESWQGEDMMQAKKNNRVYFFAPWSDYLFGYREGNSKYIFNATNNTSEIYDLKNDPGEKLNLANDSSGLLPMAYLHLAAWVQYQDRYMKQMMNP